MSVVQNDDDDDDDDDDVDGDDEYNGCARHPEGIRYTHSSWDGFALVVNVIQNDDDDDDDDDGCTPCSRNLSNSP